MTDNAVAKYAIKTSNVFLSLAVDKTPYPITVRRGVQFMCTENVKQKMPTYQLTVDDAAKQLGKSIAINDGTDITVVAGTSESNSLTFSFKAFGKPARTPSSQMSGAYTYHILGISKAVAMATARPSGPINGSSKDVFLHAAKTFGLALVSNFNPNDVMAWVPSNMPWSRFLGHTANHAFESEHSVTSHSIDSQDRLHMHNIPALMKGDVKAYIYNKGIVSELTPKLAAISYSHISRAGTENHKAVYGATTVQPSSDGNTTVHKKAKASLLTDVIDANESIKTLVQSVPKMLFAPFDCGNTHDKYIAARHQNFRMRAVYNQNVVVGIAQFSGLHLYDLVYFSSTDSSGDTEQDVTGKYLVTAITRFVAGGRYFEKLELTSSGLYSEDSSLV